MNLVILRLRSSLLISVIQLSFVLLFIFPFLAPANAETPPSINPVASEIRDLTQAQTRIVWCRDIGAGAHSGNGAVVTQRRLIGFDTEDGRGERVILPALSDYARPMLTPRGERVIFSNQQENKIYIVNWDGSGLRCLGNGFAMAVWRDPTGGVEWVYGAAPITNSDAYWPIQRAPIDCPDQIETVWTRTKVHADNFQLSADGRQAGGVFPWPDCGIAELPDRDWKKYGKGCWPSLAPDNSGLFWIFDGAHRNLTLFKADTDERWVVNINQAPGIEGYEIYHPRWSNHPRFMAMTGPYKLGDGDNRIRGGGPAVEIYLGRFDSRFRAIERWVRVTYNTNADFYPDVWIAPGPARDQPGSAAAVAPRKAASTPVAMIPWPGNTAGLVFLWENRSSKNEIMTAGGQAGWTCRAEPRGRARFDRYFGMDLSEGVFTTEPAIGKRLLATCQTGNQFSVEAVLTPRQTELPEGSRVISFAGGETDNMILSQENDRLVLRLITSGSHDMRPVVSLCRLTSGVPQHVIVSYAPGRLQCFLNGQPLHVTNTFAGGLESWGPGNLVFGDQNRFWPGTLDHIALYGRAIQAPEARKNYARIADRLKIRCALARLVLNARLAEVTSIPTPASIRPYRRALVVNRYDNLTVIHGQCAEQQILAAHWAILDGQVLDTARRQKGKEYRLTLEPFDAHPELEGERLIMDSEEFLLPLYYEVEW